MRRFALLGSFALGCGSSPPPAAPPPPSNTPPPPAATALAGEARRHQAIDHMDRLPIPATLEPEMAAARLQAIQMAREAGIVGDDQTPDCVKRWTNAVVDCVLAASDSPTAKACIPAS